MNKELKDWCGTEFRRRWFQTRVGKNRAGIMQASMTRPRSSTPEQSSRTSIDLGRHRTRHKWLKHRDRCRRRTIRRAQWPPRRRCSPRQPQEPDHQLLTHAAFHSGSERKWGCTEGAGNVPTEDVARVGAAPEGLDASRSRLEVLAEVQRELQ
eukprot:3939344-Rhodomonas_salina.1